MKTTKEKPILFSSSMVRAILEGRKTQTRRIGKCQMDTATGLGVEYFRHVTNGLEATATYDAFPGKGTARWGLCVCPYGIPGDRLWVRETFYCDHCEYQGALTGLPALKGDDLKKYMYYEADGPVRNQIPECEGTPKLKPSIFMPRWASRINLEIVAVRVERLQEISEADALAEGVTIKPSAGIASEFVKGSVSAAQFEYYALWESINGKGSWAKNPWVWIIEFKRI